MKNYIFFFFVLLCVKSHAQSVEALIDKYQAVGLSVAVVKEGRLVYEKAWGKKNLETSLDLKTGDIFRIASISKSFTATALMQLVEAKKVKLDSDVSTLLGFNVRNPKYLDKVITVEMLLSHTSSLNDSQGYFQLDVIDPVKNKDSDKCYNDYMPGSAYQYCNLNFNLAGTIIERISGERFDQYIVNHILRPLGLYGGYCIDSLDASRFATIYEYKGGFKESDGAYNPRRDEIDKYVMGYSTPIFSPTGGMKISAPDLAKYMSMHMGYGKWGRIRIIKKKSAIRMQTAVLNAKGYGLALTNSKEFIPGEELVGHTGSAYGLYSIMFFHPKKQYGIVAITNGCKDCGGADYNNFLQEVAQVLFKEKIK